MLLKMFAFLHIYLECSFKMKIVLVRTLIHCSSQKKKVTHFNISITAHIICGIVSISFCNATTFFSIQSCINFSPRSCSDDGRVRSLRKVFSSTSQRFSMGLRSGLWWPMWWKKSTNDYSYK